MNLRDFVSIYLELAVTTLVLVMLFVEALVPRVDRRRLGQTAAIGLAAFFLVSLLVKPLEAATFGGMYRLDEFAIFFKRFFLAAGVFVMLMSADFVPMQRRETGGFYSVLLLALVGMMLCASVNDFALLFVSVELVTVSFYVMVSFLRREVQSLEAGTKYLIIGALSSGFMVFGIAFIFGTTGATNFDKVATALREISEAASGTLALPMGGGAFLFGVIMVLVGLGFKIGSVPFQIWIPDVYQGAPTPVTAFLAAGSKAAGVVLLARTMCVAFPEVQLQSTAPLSLLIAALAALSLLYGNLAAIPQRNIKRLFGYSSIGHAGYLLTGLAATTTLGVVAVIYYLTAYLFTTLAAFMVIIAFFNATGSDEISSYSGLAKRSPLLALAMLLAMFSLAGIPPLAGFFGKFLIFSAVIQAAPAHPQLYALAFVGIAMAVVSLYFYLGVVRAMYMQAPEDTKPIEISLPMRVALYAAIVAILVLGIFQGPMTASTHIAATSLTEKSPAANFSKITSDFPATALRNEP